LAETKSSILETFLSLLDVENRSFRGIYRGFNPQPQDWLHRFKDCLGLLAQSLPVNFSHFFVCRGKHLTKGWDIILCEGFLELFVNNLLLFTGYLNSYIKVVIYAKIQVDVLCYEESLEVTLIVAPKLLSLHSLLETYSILELQVYDILADRGVDFYGFHVQQLLGT